MFNDYFLNKILINQVFEVILSLNKVKEKLIILHLYIYVIKQ